MAPKLKGVISNICNKYDVSISFKGSTAGTDGKVITVPYLADLSTNKGVDVIVGYLYHETGHVLYSDMNTIRTLPNSLKNRYGIEEQVSRSIINFVEDIRVETSMERRSSSVVHFLSCMNLEILQEIMGTRKRVRVKKSKKLSDIAEEVLMYMAYTHINNLQEKQNSFWKGLLSTEIFKANMDKIDNLVLNIKRDCNTGSLMEYTEKVIEMLYLPLDVSKAKQPEESKDSKDKQPEKPKELQDLNDKEKEKLSEAINGMNTECTDTDKLKRKLLSGMSLNTVNALESIPKCEWRTSRVKEYEIDNGTLVVPKLKKALSSSLRGFKNKDTKRRQLAGTLDMSGAGRLMYNGNLDIYKSVKRHRRINTTIDLCVDVSRSTESLRINSQMRSLVVGFDGALKGTGVTYNLSIFNHMYLNLKKEKEKLDVEEHLSYLTPEGGTRLGNALICAAENIITRSKDRKIIIVITDGAVGKVNQVDSRILSCGIEVYYIVIGSSRSTTIPSNRLITISDSDFTDKAAITLRNILTKGNVK